MVSGILLLHSRYWILLCNSSSGINVTIGKALAEQV